MSRLPIRIRLTLAFAGAMAIVLAATGGFLYVRLASSLDEAVRESLEGRLADLEPRVRGGDPGLGEGTGGGLVDPDERFVLVVDDRGRVLAGTPGLDDLSLAESGVLERTRSAQVVEIELGEVPGLSKRALALATRVESAEGSRVLVVGQSLEDRDEAVRGFLATLLLIGPAALLLASLLGYGLATAALRPVEAMRREATAISGAEPGRRLPLPRSQDEVRRLGDTLNAMLARLEEAIRRERGFVADASHELRTPLAVLQTELELALRHPRTAAELEHAIRSAAGETERLARLAEDLLLLARSDQGQLIVRRDAVHADDALERVAERFRARAEHEGRELVVEPSPPLRFEGDSARLEQALGNLVENALRHGRGRVALGALAEDGRVELHVRDEGPGFPAEFLPHAFERFSRADPARTGPGAGLGLAIAVAVAEAHGGSAHAANRADGGADVWLSIPGG